MDLASEGEEEMESMPDCYYMGTDQVEMKIWLIGVFAVSVCAVSVILNTFFSAVFWTNSAIRKTPVFYFGILAHIDIVMALNYVIVIAVPVYFDYYESLWVYHLFLSYFRIMLMETAIMMFASMLLIVLATTERLLRTVNSRNVIKVRKNVMAEQFNVLSLFLQHHQQPLYVRKIREFRKFLEKNRPMVCVFCITMAILYKGCHYFEVTAVEKNCTDFARYEISLTELSSNANYRFWWMFVTRNLVDRIIPFVVLVVMNAIIINALKKEHAKLLIEPKATIADTKRSNRPSKASLREATFALVGLITTYLMSQTLTVIITVWETLDRDSLETTYVDIYSYLNDIVSILPLIASCLRYPIYLSCNRSIRMASLELFKSICSCMHLSSAYTPIEKNTNTDTSILPVITDSDTFLINGRDRPIIPVETNVAIAEISDQISDDSEQEWQL